MPGIGGITGWIVGWGWHNWLRGSLQIWSAIALFGLLAGTLVWKVCGRCRDDNGSGWHVECVDASAAIDQPLTCAYGSQQEADSAARKLLKENPNRQVFVVGPGPVKYRMLP